MRVGKMKAVAVDYAEAVRLAQKTRGEDWDPDPVQVESTINAVLSRVLDCDITQPQEDFALQVALEVMRQIALVALV